MQIYCQKHLQLFKLDIELPNDVVVVNTCDKLQYAVVEVNIAIVMTDFIYNTFE